MANNMAAVGVTVCLFPVTMVMKTLYQPVTFSIFQAHYCTIECSAPQFSVFLVVQWPFLHYRTHIYSVYITVASHGELSLLNITAFILGSDFSLDLHLEPSGGRVA